MKAFLFLQQFHQSSLSGYFPAEPSDDGLAKLKKDLGKTRVEEFEEKILKYTRRDVPKTAE